MSLNLARDTRKSLGELQVAMMVIIMWVVMLIVIMVMMVMMLMVVMMTVMMVMMVLLVVRMVMLILTVVRWCGWGGKTVSFGQVLARKIFNYIFIKKTV